MSFSEGDVAQPTVSVSFLVDPVNNSSSSPSFRMTYHRNCICLRRMVFKRLLFVSALRSTSVFHTRSVPDILSIYACRVTFQSLEVFAPFVKILSVQHSLPYIRTSRLKTSPSDAALTDNYTKCLYDATCKVLLGL